ncbi:hypothetical protein [Arcanobacterium canis]
MTAHSFNTFLLHPQLQGEPSIAHLRAWLEYKTGRLLVDGAPVADPDMSAAAKALYRELWCETLGVEVRPGSGNSGQPEQYVQGDWMCTVATVLREGLRILIALHPELCGCFPPRVRDCVGGVKYTWGSALLHDMSQPTGQQKLRQVWANENLSKFARNAYTAANLIIVPDGFNGPRGIDQGIKDFWDLTLQRSWKEARPLVKKGEALSQAFAKLMEKNLATGDPLCLAPWLTDDGEVRELTGLHIVFPELFTGEEETSDAAANHSPEERFVAWNELLGDMNSRILQRRRLLETAHEW